MLFTDERITAGFNKREESPSYRGIQFQLMAGEGDFRKSETEIKPPLGFLNSGKDEMVR